MFDRNAYRPPLIVLKFNKPKDLPHAVISLVYTPTFVAFIWISVRFVFSGLIVWASCMLLAYKLQLFENFREWPTVSRGGFYCGQGLIPLALGFILIPLTYWIVLPIVLYGLLNIAANRALTRKLKSPQE